MTYIINLIFIFINLEEEKYTIFITYRRNKN